MNEYERACERFAEATEKHAEACARASKILSDAEDQYEAALRDLARFESSPGIPLPRYRTGTAA